MTASLAKSSIKQYSSCLKQWWQYSTNNSIDIFNPTVSVVLSYLSAIFDAGASYQTLNCHRSAISLIAGQNIGQDESLRRWFKGIFKLKPYVPKYNSSWDPAIVLSYIEKWYPLENINLEKLTKKTVILLALATGQRSQTLFSINIHNIMVNSLGVDILITDILKTSRLGTQTKLMLPYFVNKPEICPVKTLLKYIEVTEKLRSQDYLFVSYRRPYHKVSGQTISRWIKQVMNESGVDDMFSPHSTRHASTSKAFRAGLSVDSILSTVGWSRHSSTFAKHYNRPLLEISNNHQFAAAVCQK